MPEPINPPADPAPQPVVTRAAINAEIRGLAATFDLGDAWANNLIDNGASEEQARADAIAAVRSRASIAPRVSIAAHGFDDPAVRAGAMGEAIYTRLTPGREPSAQARQFCGLTLPELARESLRHQGVSVTGLDASAVVSRALGGLHTTSDFAIALGDAVGRTLRASYQAAPSGLRQVARQVSLADFRARTFVQMSGFSALERVGEHGEFTRGTIEESGETAKLETFGKVFGISRQAVVNDDIGALSDIPRKMGIAAAQFEAAQLAALLLSGSGAGPTMADSVALFNAAHGNVAASGAALSVATLSAGRQAMRAQTDESGQLIAVVPRYLVVGPAIETEAEQLMASITPLSVDEVQPIRLTPVVEPRISGKGWYVVCDPGVCDGLIYCHLAGQEGPQIETRNGFDIDGVETRVRLDFGCAFIDWRSWYRNQGAA